jgi:hypothetical protein
LDAGLLVVPGLLEFVGQRVALLLDGAQRLGHGELARHLAGIETGLQPWISASLAAAACCSSLAAARRGQLDGVALVLLGQLQPLVQLLLEGLVAHLLQDVRVAGLVDLEGLAAVRADDVVHGILLRIES